MRCRVAHVFVSMPVGGAEDFSVGVASRMPARFEVIFVCLRSLGVVGEELRQAGKPIYLIPAAVSKRWNPFRVWRLARWLKRNRISIVHTQTYHAHIHGIPAARLAGIRSVLHQQKTFAKLKPHRHFMMKLAIKLATRVATLSEKTRNDFIEQFQLPSEKVLVIPNAIDRQVFHPAKSASAVRAGLGLDAAVPLIGSVASLNAVKNHEATIHMVASLEKHGLFLKAVIIGEGNHRQKLEEEIARADLQPKVSLVGRKRPVLPWLQALDVFVLASHWEGQPLALLQAIACEIPIVASRIEGNVAALGNLHPGLFEADDIEEYATKVEQMLTDSDMRTRTLDFQAAIKLLDTTTAAAELAKLYDAILLAG